MNLDRLLDLDFADKRVTVVGLGLEGVDTVRYLASRGARVTISDAKPREHLADRVQQVADLSVRFSLGGNDPRAVTNAEAVFVSQGVPLDLPGLDEARRQGVPVWSMLTLFMELCPGPIVGITGSSGKTTTTALLGEMFLADEKPVFVGGNIGVGLLDHLSDVRAYTWVVLEISHTQLQMATRSPHVACLLNVTPNHLDRFPWEEYRDLKRNVYRFQTAEDVAVFGYDDPETRAIAAEARGARVWFSLGDQIPGDGVYSRDGLARFRRGRYDEPLFPLSSLRLRGRHNQQNAVAAAAVASACGVTPEAIAYAVESFAGVPHRLEHVATLDGADYYNDSIATTPERTLAGIRSFQQPLVLLLGGRDKHLPLEELARESASGGCRAVILFGESAPKLEDALREGAAGAGAKGTRIVRVAGLPEAVQAARRYARPGDAVLLSPACTSFDAYDNFERRGEHFRSLVEQYVKEVQPSLP
ncbi:MAG: UDP-N-acetylmuramoyl-L-alanine--D-glutamate ligase [Dehalococcoidia bacterium]|nr:MAG: UDP-N-acetylmuramoyl-L-alanine--D-glutamate ligase [Dehalococcoidia bacterium]